MADQTESSASRSEAVYFRGPDILVTSRWIDTGHGRFLVTDLTGFRRIYEEKHPARKIALICAGVELVLAAPLAATYGAVSLLCAGVAAAGGVGLAVAIDSGNRPAWMVLVAEHRGRLIALYSTADRERFGQVHRAVQRAVEANEDPAALPGTDVMVAGGRPAPSATSQAHPRRSARR